MSYVYSFHSNKKRNVWGAFKKKWAGGLGIETSTCMPEVLALAVEALVPLWHKVVNGCLIKFPGLRCKPVLHVLLDVVIRSESFAHQSLFLGDQKWHNLRREVWTVWRVTKNLPLEFLQECCDYVGRMRPWIVVKQNDPTGVRTTLCYTTILSLVCTFQTSARLFFNASSSYLFGCPLYIQ